MSEEVFRRMLWSEGSFCIEYVGYIKQLDDKWLSYVSLEGTTPKYTVVVYTTPEDISNSHAEAETVVYLNLAAGMEALLISGRDETLGAIAAMLRYIDDIDFAKLFEEAAGNEVPFDDMTVRFSKN